MIHQAVSVNWGHGKPWLCVSSQLCFDELGVPTARVSADWEALQVMDDAGHQSVDMTAMQPSLASTLQDEGPES